MDDLKFNPIEFELLEDTSEDGLFKFIEKKNDETLDSVFIVATKYKYSFESDDEWTFENLMLVYTFSEGYMWEYDWNEGQQDVEFLAVATVPTYWHTNKKENKDGN